MEIKLALTLISVALVSGCAKRADAISPVNIPLAAYSNLSCQELASELNRERDNMNVLAKKQNQAATGDAIGVFLIGVPTASVTGHDREGNLSVSKGKVLSIENTIKAKSCNSTQLVENTETPKPLSSPVVE